MEVGKNFGAGKSLQTQTLVPSHRNGTESFEQAVCSGENSTGGERNGRVGRDVHLVGFGCRPHMASAGLAMLCYAVWSFLENSLRCMLMTDRHHLPQRVTAQLRIPAIQLGISWKWTRDETAVYDFSLLAVSKL